jgi:predicted SAM-dependent methyltransferase
MKLHLGSGPVRFEGWLNIDLDAPQADMHLDLRQPLPFDDASVEYIMNEHFIEHLTRENALALLTECRRVLSTNGVLRLSTPNLKFVVACYLARNIGEWGDLWEPATPCRLVNEGLRLWGHQFVYDAEELVSLLRESGFADVRFVRWRESIIKELAGRETRPFHGELIVEATKTGRADSSDAAVAALAADAVWLSDDEHALLSRVAHMEQTIIEQAARIGGLEAELSASRSSWHGRLGSIARTARRH